LRRGLFVDVAAVSDFDDGDDELLAPAKVQAALLEAMEERQVTVAGTTHPLPDLFMVMATQNPIEQEGTYPLPEAQMDRFLLYIRVDYPDGDNEMKILELVRGENSNKGGGEAPEPVMQEAIFAARDEVNAVKVSNEAAKYMVDLVMATRRPADLDAELASWITVGASPRATIALDAASRARAWLQGRAYVSPEDIQAMAPACLSHRIHLSYEAEAAGKTRDDLVNALIERVAVTA